MNRWTLVVLVLFLLNTHISAQEEIFPGLQGEELILQLRQTYRPSVALTSSQVKDTLYAVVHNRQDTVKCVYSGHYLVLPGGVDPSQWLFMNGETNGINLEHLYPVSKGATEGTGANLDMHHLYPTRVRVNSDRASFPLGEIPDAQTLRWYFGTEITSSIPSSSIDAYSEWNNALFEPREDFKGDAARAIFYFYTMYQQQATSADPSFFELQRPTLLAWHEMDPVSEFEQERSKRVAQYQEGKENPFILDPTLAYRAFCMEGEPCALVATDDVESVPEKLEFHLGEECTLFFKSRMRGKVHIMLYDLAGREVENLEAYLGGEFKYAFPVESLAPGFYLLRVTTPGWQSATIVPYLR